MAKSLSMNMVHVGGSANNAYYQYRFLKACFD